MLKICLTPVRNEEWIIRRFLQCASLWADYIILADQQSTDNTREIAKEFKKVILIDNPVGEMFNEYQMRRRLFEQARKIKGDKILFALDADEAFSANLFTSSTWKELDKLPPATLIDFQWANLRPGCSSYWSPNFHLSKGYVDDGSPYRAGKIHTVNLPVPKHARHEIIKDIKVLHYQYTDWQRMESKHRWYQVWEWINHEDRNAIDIYRQYHHMDIIPSSDIKKVPKSWYSFYQDKRIDMTSVTKTNYWWDSEVRLMIKKYSAKYFSYLDIWDLPGTTRPSFIDMFVHKYLKISQKYTNRMLIQYIDKYLPLIWGKHHD